MSELTIQSPVGTQGITKLITHTGEFHAEDVVAAAIMELLALYQDAGCSRVVDIVFLADSVEMQILNIRNKSRIERNPLNIFPLPIYRTIPDGSDSSAHSVSAKDVSQINTVWEYLSGSNWFSGISKEDVDKFGKYVVGAAAADSLDKENTITIVVSNYNVGNGQEERSDAQFSAVVMEFMRMINQWFYAMAYRSPEAIIP